MPAKLTLFPPQRASRFLVVRDEESLDIGRDSSCALVLEDTRISKRHARLRWTGKGWTLEDLGSKNGTTVNGRCVPAASSATAVEAQPGDRDTRSAGERPGELCHGDWISLGGLMGRFEMLTAAQAAMLQSERLARLHTSAAMKRRLSADLEPVDLLLRLLHSAMEITGGERGFVLVVEADGTLRAEVAAGFSVEDVQDDRFRGSLGAVRQVLRSRGLVVAPDAQAHPSLGRRASIVTQGIGSLACVPLVHEGKLLGVMYVDSRKLVATFSDLALEILEALADHTAVVLASSRLSDRVRKLLKPADAGLVSQLQRRLDELLPAV
jgi:hypothetical protein